jgi:hypothetical protein
MTIKNRSFNSQNICLRVQQATAHLEICYMLPGYMSDMITELESIISEGQLESLKGDWWSGAVVYKSVLDQLVTQEVWVHDETGDFATVFSDVCSLLEECLEHLQQPKLRGEILNSLVRIVDKDTEIGGFCDKAYEVVLTRTTPAEKAVIAAWMKSKLEAIQNRDGLIIEWKREAYKRFLRDLQEANLTQK